MERENKDLFYWLNVDVLLYKHLYASCVMIALNCKLVKA